MLHECATDDRALAVDELDDFRREPCLEQDLDEEMRRVGDVLGGLEDHRVSAQQRRKHLPGRNRERKIERRDEAGDADRAPIAHRPLVAQLRRHHATEQSPAFGRRIECGVDPLLHVAARLGENLPHLARHRARNDVLSLDEQLPHALQHLAADRRRCLGPLRKPAFGRGNRALQIVRPRTREAADHVVPVRRVAILEVVTGRRGDPVARNEILERFSHQCVDRGSGQNHVPLWPA